MPSPEPKLSTVLLRPDTALLLIVDVQEKFAPVVQQGDRIIGNIAILAEAARRLAIPVVLSEQYVKGLGPTVAAVRSALPENVVSFEKTAFGCWQDSAIRTHLETLLAAGRRQVILCGVETHVCINQTAHQLLGVGYQVHLVQDAVSSRTLENHEAGIQKMRRSGVIPATVEIVLFELLGDAKHPAFKEIQALIK